MLAGLNCQKTHGFQSPCVGAGQWKASFHAWREAYWPIRACSDTAQKGAFQCAKSLEIKRVRLQIGFGGCFWTSIDGFKRNMD
jgi:hypothetical protein